MPYKVTVTLKFHCIVYYMIVQAQPNIDGTLTFTHVRVDSSQTVLEHLRRFHSYLLFILCHMRFVLLLALAPPYTLKCMAIASVTNW